MATPSYFQQEGDTVTTMSFHDHIPTEISRYVLPQSLSVGSESEGSHEPADDEDDISQADPLTLLAYNLSLECQSDFLVTQTIVDKIHSQMPDMDLDDKTAVAVLSGAAKIMIAEYIEATSKLQVDLTAATEFLEMIEDLIPEDLQLRKVILLDPINGQIESSSSSPFPVHLSHPFPDAQSSLTHWPSIIFTDNPDVSIEAPWVVSKASSASGSKEKNMEVLGYQLEMGVVAALNDLWTKSGATTLVKFVEGIKQTLSLASEERSSNTWEGRDVVVHAETQKDETGKRVILSMAEKEL